jgi:hypothetical protein
LVLLVFFGDRPVTRKSESDRAYLTKRLICNGKQNILTEISMQSIIENPFFEKINVRPSGVKGELINP